MRAGRWGWLGYLSSGAFVVAAVTYGATTLELVGPVEPAESGPLTARLARHFASQREGFVYEQVANWSLVTALLSLGLLSLGSTTTSRASDSFCWGWVCSGWSGWRGGNPPGPRGFGC